MARRAANPPKFEYPMLTIYKPGQVPVKGLRTSIKGAQLPDGYFQAIDNLRWDTGTLVVRSGIAEVSTAAPSTTCLGAWSGALNGTYYVISVWSVSSKARIYSLNLSTGAMTELTVAGSTTRPGWTGTGTTVVGTSAGETRLPTTGTVTFCVHSIPRRLEGTADYPPLDFLSIQNGADWPVIYNPSGFAGSGYTGVSLCFHKKVRIPPGGNRFSYLGTWSAKLQVGGTNTAGRITFTNKKVDDTTNQSTWAGSYTSAAPYNASPNYCILLTAATPLTGDWTKWDFGSGGKAAFPGEQITFVVEGGATALTDITDFLDYSKVQLSHDDTTYYTIYNPDDTDPALTIRPITLAMDAGNNRYQVTFSLSNVPTSSSIRNNIRYIKITRLTGKGVAYTLTFLAIAGAGSGAGMTGGTEWGLSYSHLFSGAESAGIVGTNKGYDLLKNIGGPQVVKSGSSSVAGAKIVGSIDLLYDFRFDIQNVENGTIYGGLEGPNSQNYSWSSHFDLYFRDAEESAQGSAFLYWQSAGFYAQVLAGGDHTWQIYSAYTVDPPVQGGTPKSTITVYSQSLGSGGGTAPPDRTLRDPGTPLPSAFNVAMPRAFAVATANQRSFAGAIRDESDNYVYSDLYFSELSHPFRFASVQESETSASRVTFAGERVRAIVMSAAAANKAVTIYVATDQAFYALGTAGGFVGSGYDSTSLGVAVRINSHGTNEPFSFAERSGVLFYVDQEGQIIRFQDGMAVSISRNAVDDKTKSIPAAHRGKASAAFFKDRYYLAYTPSGGSSNTKILGWNDVLEEWEFSDSLPSGVIGTFLSRAYDASQAGSGQRLLVFGSSDSKIYGYEEGSTEPGSATGPAVSLKTKEFQSPNMDLLHLNYVQAMIDAHTATLNVDRYYKPRDTQFRTAIDCSDSESKPKAIKRDTKIPTEQTATGKSEDGWSMYVDLNGALGAGKTIWRLEAEIDGLTKSAGER